MKSSNHGPNTTVAHSPTAVICCPRPRVSLLSPARLLAALVGLLVLPSEHRVAARAVDVGHRVPACNEVAVFLQCMAPCELDSLSSVSGRHAGVLGPGGSADGGQSCLWAGSALLSPHRRPEPDVDDVAKQVGPTMAPLERL